MVKQYIPASLAEALAIRAAEPVVPYGGGTDLMIEAAADVDYLFLHQVPELRKITDDGAYLRIGAACTFSEALEHRLTPAILKAAVEKIGAPAIRNIGTIGGNIGNGSAKADSALIFFVTDSLLRLVSAKGQRVLPIRQFYLGRKQLALEEDELIAEVLMPRAGLDNFYYQKIGARNALAISRLSFAGILDINNGAIANCATAFGAITEVILRRPEIDALLIGKSLAGAREAKDEYLAAYDAALVPIRGRISAEYRKQVCMNLLRDFLQTNDI